MTALKSIVLQGQPLSVNAMYRGGRRFLTSEGKAVKERYGYEAKAQFRGTLVTGEVRVKVIFYFADKRRHDIDNCLKALLDSMTGVLWRDDNQIVHLEVSKLLDKKPRVELSFEELLTNDNQ